MTFLAKKIVTARKRHRCFVCQLAIWPGQQYVRTSNVHDGRAYSITEHQLCRRIALRMLRECPWDFHDGYDRLDVAEWLMEQDRSFERIDEIIVWRRLRTNHALYELERRLRAS